MADETLSQFVLLRNSNATNDNRQPHLTGHYKLAGEEITNRVALWSNVSPRTDRLYAQGVAEAESIITSLRSRVTAEEAEAPPNINLRVGQAVIFANENADPAKKQPNFWGYVREPHRYVRLAGWERGNTITGTAEPYRRNPQGEPASPEPGGTV